MAASAGTNPGSTPEGVGVGVTVGVAVGVGASLAVGVEEGDASEEGDPLAEDVGAVLTAAAQLHPARTIARAKAAQAGTIRRDRDPPGIHM
jgi:hypothetical protein